MTEARRLWHYTCAHSAPGIAASRHVEPRLQPQLGGLILTWATDLHPPDRDALGLTYGALISCDRTEFAFEVNPEPFIRWTLLRRSLLRSALRQDVLALEAAPGLAPVHWYVANERVRVLGASPAWARVG